MIARTPLHTPGHARVPDLFPTPLGRFTLVDGSTVHPFQANDLARDRMRARHHDAETHALARASGWPPGRFPRALVSLLRRVPVFSLRPASSPRPIEAVLASNRHE